MVKKQGRPVQALVKIWVNLQKASVKTRTAAYNPEAFANVLECYPRLHGKMHLEIRVKGAPVKLPYMTIAEEFMKMTVNTRRQAPTAMFGELCRILTSAEGKHCDVDLLCKDPSMLAQFIVK